MADTKLRNATIRIVSKWPPHESLQIREPRLLVAVSVGYAACAALSDQRLTCPARSGSSILVHLLRSHPEICAHDEVFSPDKVRGLSGKYLQRSREDPGFIEWLSAERYRDPIRFLYKFVLDPDGKKTVGFKLKHDELVLPGYETVRNEIASNRKLRIVHLRRNNLLRRYLSH